MAGPAQRAMDGSQRQQTVEECEMRASPDNAHPSELAHFGALASRWWDPQGPQKALHVLNPVRLAYVAQQMPLVGKQVLDVGCGAGLLAEALAAAGAKVTALDLAPELIEVAQLHLLESALHVDYRLASIAQVAAAQPAHFDVVTCMELLEHVPDPQALIADCVRVLAPGGRLIISTLNRNPASFALAIVGAEYLSGLVARGTHHYAQFIRPAELAAWLRAAGLVLDDVRGLYYNPLNHSARLGRSPAVNYIASARREQ